MIIAQAIWGPAFGLTRENQLINPHLISAFVSCINYVIQKGYDNILSNQSLLEGGREVIWLLLAEGDALRESPCPSSTRTHAALQPVSSLDRGW